MVHLQDLDCHVDMGKHAYFGLVYPSSLVRFLCWAVYWSLLSVFRRPTVCPASGLRLSSLLGLCLFFRLPFPSGFIFFFFLALIIFILSPLRLLPYIFCSIFCTLVLLSLALYPPAHSSPHSVSFSLTSSFAPSQSISCICEPPKHNLALATIISQVDSPKLILTFSCRVISGVRLVFTGCSFCFCTIVPARK